jgi:hypothetical protein
MRWENSIKAYFNTRLYLTVLDKRIRRVMVQVYAVLKRVAFVLGIILTVVLYLLYLRQLDSIHRILQLVSRLLQNRVWLRVLVWLFFLLYFLYVLLIFWYGILRPALRTVKQYGWLQLISKIVDCEIRGFILVTKRTGDFAAHAFAYLIYSILLVPSVIMYAVVAGLLSPYLLAEQISVRFGLRPTLGVLGTITLLLGMLIQLLQ